MPEPQSPGLLGLPSTVWIALILGVAGVFAISQKPFQDTRPPNPIVRASRPTPGDDQTVEARLWEDPFAAVASASARVPSAKIGTLTTNIPDHNGRTLLLGAMVTGAPYPDDVETRRRARYAVLAGLYRSGFIPLNHERIGYFKCPTRGPPDIGPHDIAAFEWFKRADSALPTDRVLLLWLDQDGFRDLPIRRLSYVLNDIANPQNPQNSRVTTSILGPADSDGLRSMYDEAKVSKGSIPKDSNGTPWPDDIRPMEFYSSRATASDASVLNVDRQANTAKFSEELHRAMEQVQFYRTVADDQQVAYAVIRELSLRGVDKVSEIALVAERDTLYARGMGGYFGGCSDPPRTDPAKPNDNARGEHVLCFTYLRGLDGLTPLAPNPTSSALPAQSGKSPDSAAQNNASPIASDDATGQGQLDYLRRLADSIAATRDSSKCPPPDRPIVQSTKTSRAPSCTSRRIRAIGVISSDIYDKLLILQALRTALPSVTYFTFDLDARLLEQRNLKSTRQLLVGSSLGLSLRSNLQGDIPPFRDTYQTTTFFSTMLALHRFLKPQAATDSAERGLQWTATPRIFEIGRTQAFDLKSTDDDTRSWCDFDGLCPSIAAVRENTLWSSSVWWPKKLLVGAILAAFCLSAWAVAFGVGSLTGDSGTHRIPFWGERRWNNGTVSLVSIMLILAATCLAWPWLVRWVTQGSTRVPTPLFGGANHWTASLVDVLAILSVAVLVSRGQRKLHENTEAMRRDFGFERTARQLIAWHKKKLSSWPRRERFAMLLWFPFGPLARKSGIGLASGDVTPLEALIAQYLHRGTAPARLLRVTYGTVISVALLIFLEAIPGTAILRQFSILEDHTAHQWSIDLISMASLFAMQFLILWAADAVLLSRSFLMALLRDKPEWPAAALKQECSRIGLSSERALLWLNLNLIARRTSCVSNLIWYPSFMLAAMTVAALTIQFGDFQFANNPMALLLGTLWVIASAVALRRAAETWRVRVKHQLEDDRLREHAGGGFNSGSVDQLDRLLDRVNALDKGAFAPYSEQPIVHAVLVPAFTYGATVGLQYLHFNS